MSDAKTVSLDLKGLKCPLPVLRTRKAIRTLDAGTILTVDTTDPLAVIDIPHFCHEDGHVLIDSAKLDGTGHRFTIRKGG